MHRRLSIQESEARIPQSRIARVYDLNSRVYDIWGTLTESKARQRAIELAGITDGLDILEVAVGTGLAFREIVRLNPQGTNVGLDISEGMLSRARKRLQKAGSGNHTLQNGSAFELPAGGQTVDILFNNYMFDLMTPDDIDRAIREFGRVLKPDGRLVLVNMTKGEKHGSCIYERIYRIFPALMGGCRGVVLSERLRDHGFTVVTREYVQQMGFPSEVILATKGG
ncbi:MAG: methyltransferase domain-containing protein [Chlorobiaceae bacterium]|nr:methyltransferase domain-containing protein [Chlorobiaceae bacterium]NTW74884.1 methyltransferase domain-containing protein [Chlorobiaceae bacterium]